jgi:adenylate cyclase
MRVLVTGVNSSRFISFVLPLSVHCLPLPLRGPLNRWLISILLALLTTLAQLWVSNTSLGERFELQGLDILFNVRGKAPPPSDIVVVALDESSYEALGVPLNAIWPRRYHAKLLTLLHELGAKKVLFDVLFSSPSTHEQDKELAEAMRQLPVVLGVDVKTTVESGVAVVQQIIPVGTLKAAASGLGLVGYSEVQGFVRTFHRDVSRAGLESLKSLGEAALDQHPHALPGDSDLINFYGPRGTLSTLSVEDILSLDPEVDPDPDAAISGIAEKAKTLLRTRIAGKIVYVGLAFKTEFGASQKDSYRTPFQTGGGTFGVEIHATVAGNLIDGNWIRRYSAGIEQGVLSCLTLILCTLIFRMRPDWAGVLVVGFVLLWCLTCYLAFTAHLFLPGLFLCSVVLPSTYLASTLYYYITTRRSQLQTKRAFEFYLSPEMAEEVAKNPKSVALGGQGAYATAMFTDIEGFTGISESMSPEQVSEMLNAYFSEVMEVIFPLKGTLIKFIGDAVFALWGAPLKVNDHANKACEAALAIQDEVEKFNATKRFPPLKTRIGIHTGSMVVGNLGSLRRFDFTAIGGSINLASRVEGANKYLGTNILVTEAVVKEMKNQIPTLLLGSIQLSGNREAVDLYTVRREPYPTAIRENWEKALREFRYRRWKSAADLFLSVGNTTPDLEVATRLYLNEITRYEATPPPEEWEGVVVFTGK